MNVASGPNRYKQRFEEDNGANNKSHMDSLVVLWDPSLTMFCRPTEFSSRRRIMNILN